MKFKTLIVTLTIFTTAIVMGQERDTTKVFKKRVLETTEINLLSSYYGQEGDNAAVSGGLGTEELADITGTIIVSIPLTDDDVLTVEAGISAYTSASSSNVDPFDDGPADPFQASSGASKDDVYGSFSGSYSHSSDDRNSLWSANASVSFTKLFNRKNTELSINGNVFFDTWSPIYPIELRSFAEGAGGLNNPIFSPGRITGNTNYAPRFEPFEEERRAQILHKNVQGSLSLDIVQQNGLLSTPFQRVYFADIAPSFIDDFQLADAIELLPDSRFKIALGGRLNWYINESVTIRSFYRYYTDNWDIKSHTAQLEVPVKISNKFTVYPSYRFYNQTAAKYFRPHQVALDILTKTHIWKFGLKRIDLKFYQYDRDTSFSSSIITGGITFVMD